MGKGRDFAFQLGKPRIVLLCTYASNFCRQYFQDDFDLVLFWSPKCLNGVITISYLDDVGQTGDYDCLCFI